MSNLNDGVGKKIVEALKKQTELENNGTQETAPSVEPDNLNTSDDSLGMMDNSSLLSDMDISDNNNFDISDEDDNKSDFRSFSDNSETFNDFINHNDKPADSESMPGNIIILKKLISQLPNGVTRHTGAQIIKQTMEALGISMKSVLTEAQEVQNNLKESSKECQMTIREYKQKISSLEKQTQNYQKQYAALNDLISLFITTK